MKVNQPDFWFVLKIKMRPKTAIVKIIGDINSFDTKLCSHLEMASLPLKMAGMQIVMRVPQFES